MAEAARGGKSHDLFSDITSTANEIFSRLPEEEFAKLRYQNQNTSKSTNGKCSVTKRVSWKIALVMSQMQFFAVFFAKIRKKDGREYEPGRLAVMQCSLDRHLKNCCRNYSIKMISAQHTYIHIY